MSTTSFKFDDKTTKMLEKLVEESGASSKVEVLRRALTLYDIVVEATHKGKEVILESKDESEAPQRIVVT